MQIDREEHPSYVMISFSRIQSNKSETLFGSSIKHRNMVRMRVKTAKKKRDLHHDWYFGDKLLLELDMSQTQFAELISSMNVGDGVPATLRFSPELGMVEECPEVKVRQQLETEFKDDVRSIMSKFEELSEEVKEILGKKNILKNDRKEILDKLSRMETDLFSNLPFVQKSFNETTDKVVADAKGEIDATMTNIILRIGTEGLAAGKAKDILLLDSEDIEF